ncbi:MAG: Abi family protein [Erysipelotrichales bacterium]|nr:Abi family protein [Erysipelotrichales bacterium]
MYKYPKQILTLDQQVQSYLDAGMIVDSIDDLKEALNSIGYYRLRGYSFQLYDKSTKKYISNTRFEDILNLYYFDRELSSLLFSMICKIEVSLRVRLSNSLLVLNDASILHDPSAFKNKSDYWKHFSKISSEISRSNEVFIKHNFDNYEGEVPIWSAVEVFSFGTLSKVIKNLKTGKGSVYSHLANYYKYTSNKGNIVIPSQKALSSWIHSVYALRNICAHNSRIYNRTIHTTPVILNMNNAIPKPNHIGLFQILLAMKYLRPSDIEWISFVKELSQLMQKYNTIDISNLNFPLNWQSYLIV